MNRIVTPRRNLILPRRYRQQQGGFIMTPYAHASGASGVSFLETQVHSTGGLTATCTFGAIPADGEMLVAVVCHAGGTPSVTGVPSGFSLRLGTDVRQTIRVYEKVAASEASAAYSFTGTVNLGMVMYRLTPAQYGTGGSNDTAGGGTLVCSSANLVVPDGSVGIAAINANGSISSVGFSDGYGSISYLGAGGGRPYVGTRTYTSGGAAENTTASWVTTRNADGLLVIYKPL